MTPSQGPRPTNRRRSSASPKPASPSGQAGLTELRLSPGDQGPVLLDLYQRAEAQLLGERKRKRVEQAVRAAGAVSHRLVHELEVRQIELELQNVELQKARDELEIALGKYTDLYDFAPVGYFSLDESGDILEANLTGSVLLGTERSRLLKRRFTAFVAPTSRPAFLAFLERVMSAPVVQSCEVLLSKEGQTPLWAGIRGAPAVACTGSAKWCRVAVSDITVRKGAEEVLRRNEVLFSTLIEEAPVGVGVVDDGLRLQQLNARARPAFMGIHPLIGGDLRTILRVLWPKRVADRIVGRFLHTLKTGEPYQSLDFVERRRNTGLEEAYEWQVQRLTLPAGEHRVVAFFNNITERKRADDVRRRIEVLTSTNLRLEEEVLRRKAAQESLKQSEHHQISLLEASRHMEEQLRHLSRKVLRAQEDERRLISRELHDVIAQTLTGITLQLAGLERTAPSNPGRLSRQIARTRKLVEHSVDLVHRFARDLRPATLDHLGLIPTLETFMRGFKEETGIQVSLSAVAAVEKLNGDQRTVVYRVAQEALLNVSRHAQASRAEVRIRVEGTTVSMGIRDDGRGFQPERVLHAKRVQRLGLLGMRERVEMLGGRFSVESVPGQGTTIHAEIPFRPGLASGRASRPARPSEQRKTGRASARGGG